MIRNRTRFQVQLSVKYVNLVYACLLACFICPKLNPLLLAAACLCVEGANKMLWFLLLLFLFIGGILYLSNRNASTKIFGVYSKPTIFFPFKFALMKFVISRRQKQAKTNQKFLVITLFRG